MCGYVNNNIEITNSRGVFIILHGCFINSAFRRRTKEQTKKSGTAQFPSQLCASNVKHGREMLKTRKIIRTEVKCLRIKPHVKRRDKIRYDTIRARVGILHFVEKHGAG